MAIQVPSPTTDAPTGLQEQVDGLREQVASFNRLLEDQV